MWTLNVSGLGHGRLFLLFHCVVSSLSKSIVVSASASVCVFVFSTDMKPILSFLFQPNRQNDWNWSFYKYVSVNPD